MRSRLGPAKYAEIGREMLTQTEGRIDVFCGAVGTGGMLAGVARALRDGGSRARIVALEPTESPAMTQGRGGAHRVEGIATGSIYVLVGLGLVLIFSVTRVVFVPFGDIVAFSALTLASMQLGRLPGTVYLVAVLAILACAVDAVHHLRRGRPDRIARGLLGYGVLPLIPDAVKATVDSLGVEITAGRIRVPTQ